MTPDSFASQPRIAVVERLQLCVRGARGRLRSADGPRRPERQCALVASKAAPTRNNDASSHVPSSLDRRIPAQILLLREAPQIRIDEAPPGLDRQQPISRIEAQAASRGGPSASRSSSLTSSCSGSLTIGFRQEQAHAVQEHARDRVVIAFGVAVHAADALVVAADEARKLSRRDRCRGVSAAGRSSPRDGLRESTPRAAACARAGLRRDARSRRRN